MGRDGWMPWMMDEVEVDIRSIRYRCNQLSYRSTRPGQAQPIYPKKPRTVYLVFRRSLHAVRIIRLSLAVPQKRLILRILSVLDFVLRSPSITMVRMALLVQMRVPS
jgi:hypothetical protein